VSQEFNVLALIKGEERYVYVYDDLSRQELLDTIQTHAADPAVSLNWFDAVVLKQKAHEQMDANDQRAASSPRLSSS